MNAEEMPERVFGFNDMFVAPEEDPRVGANFQGEHETLSAYLSNYRKTLELKCSGLDPEQLARRSVPPSDLSLLGIVRHMADVERFWFRQVLGSEEVPQLYPSEEGDNASITGAV